MFHDCTSNVISCKTLYSNVNQFTINGSLRFANDDPVLCVLKSVLFKPYLSRPDPQSPCCVLAMFRETFVGAPLWLCKLLGRKALDRNWVNLLPYGSDHPSSRVSF